VREELKMAISREPDGQGLLFPPDASRELGAPTQQLVALVLMQREPRLLFMLWFLRAVVRCKRDAPTLAETG